MVYFGYPLVCKGKSGATTLIGFAVGRKGTDGILFGLMRRITGLFSAVQAEKILPYNLRGACGECIFMSSSTGPGFHWNAERIADPLASVRHRQGRLIGRMEGLGFSLQQEAVLETLTADVLKSSEIEGEKLDAGQVRSSIARRLGIDIGALTPADSNVEGVVEMMLDATPL